MTRPPTYPIACAAAFALSTVLLPQPALAQQPWLNTSLSARARTELLLDATTLDQKIQQMQNVPRRNEEVEGCGFQQLGRHIEGIPELAIPTLRAVNGGTGVRGGDCLPEPTATGLPSAILGADLAPTPRARVRARALDGSGAEGISSAFEVTGAPSSP